MEYHPLAVEFEHYLLKQDYSSDASSSGKHVIQQWMKYLSRHSLDLFTVTLDDVSDFLQTYKKHSKYRNFHMKRFCQFMDCTYGTHIIREDEWLYRELRKPYRDVLLDYGETLRVDPHVGRNTLTGHLRWVRRLLYYLQEMNRPVSSLSRRDAEQVFALQPEKRSNRPDGVAHRFAIFLKESAGIQSDLLPLHPLADASKEDQDLYDAYMKWLYDEDRQESTMRHHTSTLRLWHRVFQKGLTDVESGDIRRFKDWCRSHGKVGATINRHLIALRSFYRFLREKRDITVPVKIRLERVQTQQLKDDVFTFQDFSTLVRQAELAGDLKTKAIFYALWYTGGRISEVASLPVIAVEQRTVLVVNKGKERQLFIPPQLRDFLKIYIASRPEKERNSPYVFTGRWPDTPVSDHYIFSRVKRYAAQGGLNVPLCHPHNFRHGIARYMLDQGANLRQVQNHLGHEKISTTAQYLDYTASEQDEWLGKYLE